MRWLLALLGARQIEMSFFFAVITDGTIGTNRQIISSIPRAENIPLPALSRLVCRVLWRERRFHLLMEISTCSAVCWLNIRARLPRL